MFLVSGRHLNFNKCKLSTPHECKNPDACFIVILCDFDQCKSWIPSYRYIWSKYFNSHLFHLVSDMFSRFRTSPCYIRLAFSKSFNHPGMLLNAATAPSHVIPANAVTKVYTQQKHMEPLGILSKFCPKKNFVIAIAIIATSFSLPTSVHRS